MSLSKMDIILNAVDFFKKEGFNVHLYKENGEVVGIDLDSYTKNGVNTGIFIDGRDMDMNDPEWWKKYFIDYVESFDIRTDCPWVNMNDEDDVEDVENWHNKLVKISSYL